MRESRRRRDYERQSPNQRLGDAPIEAAYHEKMIAIVQALDEMFNGDKRPKKVGFILMVFPFESTEGRCNYMSNGADRKDVVTLMREMIARFEGQPEVSGNA